MTGLTMNRVEEIENAIVADSEDWFDHIRDDLHVTIRIAYDFYEFLVKSGDSPDDYEVVYMMETITSGISMFNQLAHSCRSMGLSTPAISVDPLFPLDFSALRGQFMRHFEHIDDAGVSFTERMTSLFALTHLELLFLAQNFPSAIFEEAANDRRTGAEINSDFSELMTDMREMRAGRIGVAEAAAHAKARRDRRKPQGR
jgi:hypothetical protein